jgi:phosphoserine phosphatase RsbX
VISLRVDIGVASRAMPGETECGDRAGVVREGPRSLVALADGVGHGPEAAAAARSAIDSVTRDPWSPLDVLLSRCHREIAQTRGAALTLVRLDATRGEAEHAGVGNVDVVATTREALRWVSVPGIVGARVRKVRVTRQRLHPGDVLVLHTDGLSRRLDLGRHFDLDAPSLAMKLLGEYASPHDDAACVVVRC